MHTPGLLDLVVAMLSGVGFVALVGLVALAIRWARPTVTVRHELPANWTPDAAERLRRVLR